MATTAKRKPGKPREPGTGARPPQGGLSNVMAALTANYEVLTGGQRRIIDRLLADLRFGATVSAAELAEELGLSESTVTRATQALGFEGYRDLQGRLKEQLVAGVAVRVRTQNISAEEPVDEVAHHVMSEDVESIQATATHLDPATLDAVVDLVATAPHVYVFGSRGSYGLALIMSIGLRLLIKDVRLLSQAAGDLPDQLIHVERGDAVILIGFRRVDDPAVKVLEAARRAGATIVSLSDHLPLQRLADHALTIHQAPSRLMPSYAAGASVVNALVTAVSLRRAGDIEERLQEVEDLHKVFNTYFSRTDLGAHKTGGVNSPPTRRKGPPRKAANLS